MVGRTKRQLFIAGWKRKVSLYMPSEQPDTIAGLIAITEEPDTFALPVDWEGYLASALKLMPGAHLLAQEDEGRTALAFVSAQVLECALSSFLSKNGVSRDDLKKLRGGRVPRRLVAHFDELIQRNLLVPAGKYLSFEGGPSLGRRHCFYPSMALAREKNEPWRGRVKPDGQWLQNLRIARDRLSLRVALHPVVCQAYSSLSYR
jgi:hypothetical protein